MKKIIFGVMTIIMLAACSSVKVKNSAELEKKYNITKASAKNWEQTISTVIVGEALIPEWYGDDNPIIYLRKTGKMNDKDLNFLMGLQKMNPDQITKDDYEKFMDLVESYNAKMPRRFYLDDHNLKNPKGLVDYMVRESFLKMDTPSLHIKNDVATPDEWAEIVAFSRQTDLSAKDTKKLRKLLNKLMSRPEFYDEKAWYNKELSDRTIALTNLANKTELTKIEKNNINAKAMYIAYPGFFSPLDKWDN